MLAAVLGLLVGLILGLTGAGGSVIAVPLLIWGLGWTLPQAAPTALLAVSAAAILGTLSAWPQGIVRYRAAMVMACAGLLTAPLGLLAGQSLPLPWLSAAFALVLVYVSLRMLRQARSAPEESRIVRAGLKAEPENPSEPVCRMNPNTGRLSWTRPCALAISSGGLVTGFLSGLLGVGGGFVIVPILRAVTDLSFHSAVATSLMAIALTSAGTVVISIAQGQTLDLMIATPFVGGALAGMLLGRQTAARLAGPKLQMGFASVMLLIAGGMFWGILA
ncbi:sulfite exporter TauE/SafE family protein [Ketobacter sp.]|uniref:sulfite exporter TauE/SafE family protein n=1 Tax=Ketobacter sp. TaxID=2083498 RepID=UPI000F1BFC06|nr:sulfite exporter TauE/SafE family protein [Ketobacter sp.]RLT92179.1 MAG: sulfite exporter TauE/SafE family protein [Ketobacter sp.]